FVHDALGKDHARMRRVQHLLKFLAGMYDVGFCLPVTTEDIWQFRVPPVRNVVVLRVLAEYASLHCVPLVLVHEDPGLKVMPHDSRDLLGGQLERSFSGQQDVTPPWGSKNGSEQRARCVADRTPDESARDMGAAFGQS